MPEALVAVPPLQMPLENASEIGNSSSAVEITDRSTDSQNYNQVAAKDKRSTAKGQCKNKLRKSRGKRFQKKSQLKPLNSEAKGINALKLKSHIPRALVLTRSSSTASLATSDSLSSPLISLDKAASAEEEIKSTASNQSCLARQKTAQILVFHQRKSITQMDFCQVRRQMNFPIPTHAPNHLRHNKNNNGTTTQALIATKCDENMSVTCSKNSFVHKIYNQDYYFAMPERDPQMAGMRIFATIMLNAWRKRRDEVRRLLNEIADLKQGGIKAKNQIHVLRSLFRVEQKRNDVLNCQLKRSLEDISLTKSSCESLTTSLISLKADKALLEQQLLIKEQEYDSVNSFLTQTKSELFKSMTVQRELQASLSTEQRKIQMLENQKNELISEILELNREAIQNEEDLRKEIEEKNTDISELKEKLDEAEEQIKTMNESFQHQLDENNAKEKRMKQETEKLENELKIMQKYFEETLGSRLKTFWNNSLTYQKISLDVMHSLAYYALPAMPPPKVKPFPFGLTMNKVLSIMKR